MKHILLSVTTLVLTFNSLATSNTIYPDTAMLPVVPPISETQTVIFETLTSPINCGPENIMYIKQNGDVYNLGSCDYYPLLIDMQYWGSATSKEAVKIYEKAVSVQTGQWETFILDEEGKLWSFGAGQQGSHGRGEARIMDKYGVVMEDVVATYSRFAIKKDLTLWGWGEYASGQLAGGRGYNETQIPVYERYVDTPVKIMDDVVATTGLSALRKDGTLWQWGLCLDLEDQRVEQYWPTQVMTDVKYLMDGAVIKKDDSLWIRSANGVLRDILGEIYPLRVAENVKFAAKSGGSLAYIKKDGTLWVLGDNMDGLFGDKAVDFYEEPTKIMNDVSYFCFSQKNHCYAIKENGELWQLGYDPIVDGEISDGIPPVEAYKPHKIADGVMQPQIVTLELD